MLNLYLKEIQIGGGCPQKLGRRKILEGVGGVGWKERKSVV